MAQGRKAPTPAETEVLRQRMYEQYLAGRAHFGLPAPGSPEAARIPEMEPHAAKTTDRNDPYYRKFQEFAHWTPETFGKRMQRMTPDELARFVKFNDDVMSVNKIAVVAPASQPAPRGVEELGKVDTAGGQMSPAALEAVRKKNEGALAPQPKPDSAAGAPATTPEAKKKAETDFAAEVAKAETRRTQAMLHMVGAYQIDAKSRMPKGGSEAVDGIDGPWTKMARENFAAAIRARDPSIALDTPQAVDAQLRVEIAARMSDPAFKETLADMEARGSALDKDVARELLGIYKDKGFAPQGRAVLDSGVTRTVERIEVAAPAPAPVAEGVSPASQPRSQESQAWGFNDKTPDGTGQATGSDSAPPEPESPPAAEPPPLELVSLAAAREKTPLATREFNDGATDGGRIAVPPPQQTPVIDDRRGQTVESTPINDGPSREAGRIAYRGAPDSRADREDERLARQQEREALRAERAEQRAYERWERQQMREEMRADRQWQLGVRGSLRGLANDALRGMDREERSVLGPLVRPLADGASPMIPRPF